MAIPIVFDRNAPGTKLYTFEGIPLGELPRAFFQDHSRALRALINSIGKTACRIVAQYDLLRKPVSHADLSEFYVLTKVAGEEVSNFTVLPGERDWTVVVSVMVSDIRLSFIINLKSVLDHYFNGFTKNTEWEDFLHVYLYFVYCGSAFGQRLTAFINVDDWDLLCRAREEVNASLKSNNAAIVRKFPTSAIISLFGSLQLPLGHYTGKIYNWTVNSSDKSERWELAGVPGASLSMACYAPTPDFSDIRYKCYVLFAYLLETQNIVTLDTETTGLDYRADSIVSCGLAFDTHLGFYISIDHRKPAKMQLVIGEKGFIRGAASNALQWAANAPKMVREGLFDARNMVGNNLQNISKEQFKMLLNEYLLKKQIIYHNAKFDYSMVFCQTSIRLPLYMDTMLAHYVARPGTGDPSKDRRNLQHVAVTELGIPEWKADITKCQSEPKDIVAAYNARDCCYTQAISYVLWQDLAPGADRKPWRLFWEIEMKFLEPMIFSELEGLRLDREKLAALQTKLQARMKEIETQFGEIAKNPDFNINSGPQLTKLFYEQMGIKPIRRCRKCTYQHQENSDTCPKCGEESPIKRLTPAGKPALDKYVLEDMVKLKVEPAILLLEHRKAAKIVSAYTNLPDKTNKLTGKIHPSYNQARTVTGRLSSSNPNFQQLPKRGSKDIRDAILPTMRGHCLVAADYAGQEIRILAAYSGDEKLISAYNPCYKCPENKDAQRRCHLGKGTCQYEDHSHADSRCNILDIHSYITKQIHGDNITVPISQIKDHPVFDKMRTMAKGLTFALSYGGGAYGIADKNNITIDEAQKIMDDYFLTFPGVKKFILQCQQYCDEFGVIEDMVGRKRRFDYAGWSDPQKLEYYYGNGNIDLRSGLRWINNKDYRRDINSDRRAATNHPIQSLAASMTKIGAVRLYEEIKKSGIEAVIVAYIHDEILVSVRRDVETLEMLGQLMRRAMVDTMDMRHYTVFNERLQWSWPPYLDMDIDLKAGETYGSLAEFHKYVEALRKEDMENLELLGEDPDAEDVPEE